MRGGAAPTLHDIRVAHGWKRGYERYLILSRFLFRPAGFALTWIAIRLGLTSEAVSWLSGVVGLIGCAALVSGRAVLHPAGLALLVLFNLLDCVDGSLARTLKTGNPYGRFLDSVCGGIIDLGFWAVVGILAFRHPELLRYPDGFGQGTLFWLGVGGATCFLAVTLGYLERTYDELLREARERLHPVCAGAEAASDGEEGSPALAARHLSRNLRVRETHYVLLLIAWWFRAVDVLLAAYLTSYALHAFLVLVLYARRGRAIKAAWFGGRER
ncbi:MAG TPA: CDP-alcohol phosphatidyltransferase family protein [Methylomirabilota bacterium]|nr:CDP-alcohol phosphatidyltransferase family protein [Methylomirabilota bacterium]